MSILDIDEEEYQPVKRISAVWYWLAGAALIVVGAALIYGPGRQAYSDWANRDPSPKYSEYYQAREPNDEFERINGIATR